MPEEEQRVFGKSVDFVSPAGVFRATEEYNPLDYSSRQHLEVAPKDAEIWNDLSEEERERILGIIALDSAEESAA